MRFFIFTLLLLGLTFSSCKKKNLEFKLKGNITALNTGSDLQGVSVKVYSYGVGTNVEKLEGTAQTDASGNYELNIQRSKIEKVEVRLYKANYFSKNTTYQFDELSTENDNIKNYSLSPQSYTRFILKNNFSNDAEDELKILKVSGKTECDECCPNGTTFYYGIVDTVVVCANDGDTYMKFYWWVNGSQQHGVDSVYSVPFQTTDYTISY